MMQQVTDQNLLRQQPTADNGLTQAHMNHPRSRSRSRTRNSPLHIS